uniref:Chemokine interleukin-8-like domain-containing protein n=1 Tax=Neogobius melanostomus TaxID=47308 RepID=A0A8C6UML1_9GOBI
FLLTSSQTTSSINYFINTAGIPKCCMSTKANIPPRILAKVQRYEVQLSNGACDVAALVLHVKNFKRPICANLKVKAMLQRIQQRKRRSHHK